MTNEHYQRVSAYFVPPHIVGKDALANWGLGLAGESGEVVENIKKALFHDKQPTITDMNHELGDALFYITRLADYYGLTLAEIMQANITKLSLRYPQRIAGRSSAAEETAA